MAAGFSSTQQSDSTGNTPIRIFSRVKRLQAFGRCPHSLPSVEKINNRNKKEEDDNKDTGNFGSICFISKKTNSDGKNPSKSYEIKKRKGMGKERKKERRKERKKEIKVEEIKKEGKEFEKERNK